MPDLHIKVGGAWKAIDNASVKVGGAWKQVKNAYIKVGGAWKTVWSDVVPFVSLPADSGIFDNEGSDNPTYAGIILQNDGTWKYYNASGSSTVGGTWFGGGYTDADLWVRNTVTGDAASAGSAATGSWVAANGTVIVWVYADTNSGVSKESGSWLIEVSTDASGTPVVDSTTLTPDANYTTA